jgi:hypothetical protein
MPNVGNVVRTIRIKGESDGVEKLTADVNKLAAAQQNVAVVSDTSAKRALSLEDAWKKQTMKLDEAARSYANIARETRIADMAMREGLVTQTAHAERLQLINEKYGQASVGSKAFAAATSGVSAQLVALSAGAGPVGVFLSALGPWGIAAAVGVGAVSSAFNYLVDGANHLGDKSIELRKFSEVTGLTVTQIKALNSEGGKLGISSDQVSGGVEKFTVGLAEARKGTGALYEQVRAINPALANQLAATTNAAEGWDILARAMKATTDQSQKAALARASFGRGGVELSLLAGKTADAGGIVAAGDAIARNTGLTDEWVKKTAQLRAENLQLTKQIETMKESAYAQPILERQNQYLRAEKEITEEFLRRRSVMGRGGQGAGDDDAAAAREAAAARLGGRRGREAGAIAAAVDPATIAGWQQLDDAIAAANDNAARATATLTQMQNAAAKAASEETTRIGLLGSAATDQEKLNAKTLELNNALLQNKISQEDYNRALGAAKFEADALLRGLQDQGQLIRASSDDERARIQAAQAYRDIVEKTGDSLKANAVAAQMQANARSTSDARDMAQADADAARSAQQKADAADREAEAMRRAREEAARIAAINDQLIKQYAYIPFALRAVTDSVSSLNIYDLGRNLFQSNQGGYSQFDPKGYKSSMPGMASIDIANAERQYGKGNFSSEIYSYGSVSGARITPSADYIGRQQFGEGNYQIVNGAAQPTEEYSYKLYADRIYSAAGGRANTAANIMIKGGAAGLPQDEFLGNASQLVQQIQSGALTYTVALEKFSNMSEIRQSATPLDLLQSMPQQYINRLIGLMDDPDKIKTYQAQIDMLKMTPQNLARDEMIRQLTDSMKNLQDAVDKNTQAQLDPLFSQGHDYLNSLKIGYYQAADGGVFGPNGPMRLMPIHQYADGGIARSPQMAMFGEAGPEAFVPLKGGAIPVTIRGGSASNDNSRNVTQHITQTIVLAEPGPVSRLTARQRAQGFIAAAARAAG